MGKNNDLNHTIKTVCLKENNLNNFLQEDAIQILEKINNDFINQFIDFLSTLVQKDIKLHAYNLKIKSYNFKNTSINSIQCVNLIEMCSYPNQCFVIFYNSFLSVIVDFLFGGIGVIKEKNNQIKSIAVADIMCNKKIIKFITNFLSNIYYKYFGIETDFINKKIFLNNEISNINVHSIFLINNFHFIINNINIFFDILIPQSFMQNLDLKNHILINHHDNTGNSKKNILSFKDIQDVELNIIARMISISISENELYNLSEGDIFPIKQPDKIIGYIDNQPIFFANYKRFNEQSLLFIEEFINDNLESNYEKESLHE